MSVQVHQFYRIRFGALATAWKCSNCGTKTRDERVARKLQGKTCR
jgi:hypothetical protein